MKISHGTIFAKKVLITRTLLIAVMVSLIAGCATNSVPKEAAEFGGNWIPINSFTDKIETIPRANPYVYQATKLDGSLIGLITRWTRDTKLVNQLKCPNDYSLPKNIEAINALTLEVGIEALNKLYEEQKVNIFLSSTNTLVFDCGQTNIQPITTEIPRVEGTQPSNIKLPKTEIIELTGSNKTLKTLKVKSLKSIKQVKEV